MQEKTLEEDIELIFSDQFIINVFATKRNDVLKGRILSFISSREEKAREECRKESMNEPMTMEVRKLEWLMEYKEELLGKLPEIMRPDFTKVTSTTAKRRMTVRANGFNSCLSEVKKIIANS